MPAHWVAPFDAATLKHVKMYPKHPLADDVQKAFNHYLKRLLNIREQLGKYFTVICNEGDELGTYCEMPAHLRQVQNQELPSCLISQLKNVLKYLSLQYASSVISLSLFYNLATRRHQMTTYHLSFVNIRI